MGKITKPFTLVAGEPILATEHNSNFNTLYNDFNGNISNYNIVTTAGITDDKIEQIVTPGKVSFASLSTLGAVAGDILWASSATSFGRLAIGTSGQALQISFDSYTSFLGNFDGASGDTSFIAATGQTATFIGTAQLTTSQKKFGDTSLLLNGSTDYVTFPDSSTWDFGSGDWTVDGQFMFNGVGLQGLWSHTANSAGTRGLWFYLSAGTSINGVYSADGTAQTGISFSWTPIVGGFYHLAWVRNGADLKFYVDGLQTGSTFNIGANSIFAPAESFYVGKDNYDGLVFNGYIDEFRVSKGIARWTGNFTKPALAYVPTLIWKTL
jgi:hypothetical protein